MLPPAAVLSVALLCAQGVRTQVVTRVVDGDTVRLDDGEAVRLLGIDTPERNEPLYTEASALLYRLVFERAVRLEFDRTRRDHYRRLLAHIWLGDTLVNELLVASGLARVYLWPPDTLHRARLVEAQKAARNGKLGLWSLAPPRLEAHYVIHEGRMRFHRPGCPAARGAHPPVAQSRDSLLDLGYSACRTCRP
jgi:micrococcal nuclease